MTSLARLAAACSRIAAQMVRDLHQPAAAPGTPLRVIAAALLLGLAIGLFNQLGAPLRASHSSRVNVDEPFYLLTTVSLLEDGDLDLTNDEALRRYRAWFDHPDELWRQSDPTADGRLLSPHNVGLSVLILPAYALAGLDGVKAFLGALGGLTAAVMVLLAYRATGSLGAALGAAVCLGVSAPIFIYSTQIYPESPAALIVAVCMWLSLGARPGWRSAALLALGLNGLVWLGSKYALVGAAVGLTALVRLRPSARWVLPALLIPSTAYYTWFHLATYGGLTPYAVNRVYAGNDTITTVAMHLELWNRVYRFAGLWIDGEFGIVRWAPVVLLVVVAAPRMARQAGPLRWALPLVFGAQLLVAVFVSITMRGWWFPGRMLIVVLPLLAVPLAFALLMARGRPAPAGAAALLGGAGLALTLALREAAAAEQVVLAVDPFALAWPPFQATAALFPVYSSYTPATWLLTAAWAIAAAGLLGLGFRLSAPTCGNAADEPETASPGPPVTKQG